MKTSVVFRNVARALALGALGLLVPPVSAQTPAASPTPPPSPNEVCPSLGWDEIFADNLAADAPFPTSDTSRLPTPDCAFHEWSWEAFAWAVWINPETKLPRFLTLPTPDDLGRTRAKAKKAGALALKLRRLKPRSGADPIDEFQQAGSSGVLVDQNGQAVLYSVHMNLTYYRFARKHYGRAKFDLAPSTRNFPVGSAVFKAAWQVVPEGTTRTDAFTTQAIVPVFVNNPEATGGIQVDPTKTRTVTVALVGLHVVGVTDNHPEFLWGTFEQLKNAPALANPNDYNQPVVVSAQSYAFYKGGTLAKDCNQFDAKALKVVDAARQTLAPVTNVFRQYAWGGSDGENEHDILALNKDAQRVLAANQSGQTVWANYQLIGTVWQKPNSLSPGSDTLNSTALGSVQLANAAMETFVQGPQNSFPANSPANCFQCHNTAADKQAGLPAKNIGTSHILEGPFFSASLAAAADAVGKKAAKPAKDAKAKAPAEDDPE